MAMASIRFMVVVGLGLGGGEFARAGAVWILEDAAGQGQPLIRRRYGSALWIGAMD